MPPRRKFDKKTATTFHLVHRAQNDPLIHDENAPSMVFKEVAPPNLKPHHRAEAPTSSGASAYSSASRASTKIKSRRDLEEELGLAEKVRRNEGEAANYGIFFDDTEYDYMQHMRDLGTGEGEAMWIEAPAKKEKGKKNKKFDLAEALRQTSLDDEREDDGVSLSSHASTLSSAREVWGEEMAGSDFVRKVTYQDMQDVPDALAGFQPDMDPRLREVLEALEDEAYVDDEEDFFGELTKGGEVADPEDWEERMWADESGVGDEEDGEGWESDATVKPNEEFKAAPTAAPAVGKDDGVQLPPTDAHAPAPEQEGDGDWMAEFKKFKQSGKSTNKPAAPSDVQSFLTGASSLAGGRRKKRKGARTSTSEFSMTSSALFRTETQTLLDARFDKIEEEYADDEAGYDDGASVISGMTGMTGMSGLSRISAVSGFSQAGMSESGEAPPLVPAGFDNIMDEFLGGYSMAGKRRVKKGGYQSGLEQLDEIRKGLGPARVKGSSSSSGKQRA